MVPEEPDRGPPFPGLIAAPQAFTRPPRYAIVFGHSIAAGTVTDAVYGGLTIDSRTTHPGSVSVTVYDGAGAPAVTSTLATTYLSSAVAPSAGILPYLVQAMVDAGEPNPVILRCAEGGTTVLDLRTRLLPLLIDDATRKGIRSLVDLIWLAIGENDAQSTTESDRYALELPKLVTDLESAFPRARVVIQQIITTDIPQAPQYAAIDATEQAVVAASPYRRLSSKTGINLVDAYHPDRAGYATLGPRVVTAYQTGS